jgi:probable phosphoglycerate mutase
VIRDRHKGTLATRAEYLLLLGLACARELGATSIEVRSDSELMVRQMRGEYRVRNPALRALHSRARELEGAFHSVVYVHVPRAQNREADGLANAAIDAVGDLGSGSEEP